MTEQNLNLKCDICDRVGFKNKKSLSNHKRFHNEDFSKEFASKRIGENNPMYGVHIMGRKGICRLGENAPNWKGDDIQYGQLHVRLRKIKGTPMKCEICGTEDKMKRYEWANMTGNYRDVNDFKRLCVRCHRLKDSKWDKKTGKLKPNKGKKWWDV